MDYYNMSITPAAPPPNGVIPNFIDPPAETGIILAYTTVFVVIATLGVAARMYVRIFLMKKVQLEDYLLTLSWGFFMVFNGFVYTSALDSVMGRHAWDVNLIQLQYFLWLLNTATIIYGPMLICAKGALILLWQRIFAGTTTRCALWWFLRVLLYINIAVYICGMAIQTFTCTPREKIWQPWLEGTCINTEASFLYTAAWNLFLDVILLIIPLFSSRHLNLQKKRKWMLMGCFALGIVTCVASILRIVNAVDLAKSPDQIYDEQNSIWSAALEHTGVILVICAPAIPKLWRHFLGQDEPAADEIVEISPRQTPDLLSCGDQKFKLCANRTWIELGNKSPFNKSLERLSEKHDQQRQASINVDVEKDAGMETDEDWDYHEIKRSESVTKPMKVLVRNEYSVEISDARRGPQSDTGSQQMRNRDKDSPPPVPPKK